jgi:uncharacterized protein YndB with AHSA1/START domain
MEITKVPVANAAMLIRKPVAEVYEAFIDPAITTQFWFTKGSARLDEAQAVTWTWEMYNVSSQVRVLALEKDARILIEWSGYESPNTVEWTFTPRPDGTTFVNVTNAGFTGDGDSVVEQALGSTGGFVMVLAGLKAYLEHNIRLNLVADRFPEGL